MNILIAILIFGIIIIVHELGHFLIAKKNGIRVDEFSVGLGPTIVGKQVGETFYSLKLLPFGGACMMGEDEDRPEDDAFSQKSVWARMATIFGGPLFNFIFAWILALIMIIIAGVDLPVIAQVSPGSGAQKAGMRAGDTLVSLDGKTLHDYREFSYYFVLDYHGGTVPVTVKRGNQEISMSVKPTYNKKEKRYLAGVAFNAPQKVGPLKTVEYTFREVGFQIKITMKTLKMLVTRKLSIHNLSGPVGITKSMADSYDSAANYGMTAVIVTMLGIAILISANLGVMNLLPLPALDGGRLCFLIVEAIRGKPCPKDIEATVHTVGLFLLLGLMVFVMYQDIAKIFF